jgi:hypothetical protein
MTNLICKCDKMIKQLKHVQNVLVSRNVDMILYLLWFKVFKIVNSIICFRKKYFASVLLNKDPQIMLKEFVV